MSPYLHHASVGKKAGQDSGPESVSGSQLEAALSEASDRGRKYVGIGGGVLGALLAGGLGALTAPEGKRLRNSLIGAGIGGATGGAAGYYLSPVMPVPFLGSTYRDSDTRNIRNLYQGDTKSRSVSLAELIGGLLGPSAGEG